jgi:hypothetical protein
MDMIQRGAEVEQLLANPLLREAFEGVRQKILERIEETAIGDIDTQHELVLCLQTIKNVRRYLENWIRDGQLESERATSNSAWQKLQKRIGVRT